MDGGTTPPCRQGPARLESKLSKLSPTQLENAAFTPRSPLRKLSAAQVENALFTPLSQQLFAGSSAVESSSSSAPATDSLLVQLTQRVEEQEVRLRELESQLKLHHLSCVSEAPSEPSLPAKDCSDGDRSSVEPTTDLLRVDIADDSVPRPPAPTTVQIFSKQHTAPSSSDGSSSSSASVDPMAALVDDFSYRPDSLEAFESHLNSSSRAALDNTTPRTLVNDVSQTLLEGIGTISELTLHQAESSAKTLRNGIRAGTTAVLPKPEPWDGSISWAAVSIFDNKEEEKRASMREDFPKPRDLGFYQHGLVFKPRESDDSVYRTVLVANLPLNVKLKTLFKGILGGEVYSAHLMNMKPTAGYHMGIVTFVQEKAAAAYAEFAAQGGVYFDSQRATVTLLKTATYPMPAAMEENIFNQGHTRCLSIRGPSDADRLVTIVNHIRSRFPMLFELGDTVDENDTETEIIVRLNSIQAAQLIMRSLLSTSAMADCDIDFAPDPCARPLPGS